MAYGETRASDMENGRNAKLTAGSGISLTGHESTVTPFEPRRRFCSPPVLERAWKLVFAPRVWAWADTTAPCSRSPQSTERRRQAKPARALGVRMNEKTMRQVVYSE